MERVRRNNLTAAPRRGRPPKLVADNTETIKAALDNLRRGAKAAALGAPPVYQIQRVTPIIERQFAYFDGVVKRQGGDYAKRTVANQILAAAEYWLYRFDVLEVYYLLQNISDEMAAIVVKQKKQKMRSKKP
jgi:hypothetical protein